MRSELSFRGKAYERHWSLSNQVVWSLLGFPDGSDGKETACNVGDLGWISQSGRSPGEGNGYSLQYSCLENSTDRGEWRATIRGITKSQTWQSDSHFQFPCKKYEESMIIFRAKEFCCKVLPQYSEIIQP